MLNAPTSIDDLQKDPLYTILTFLPVEDLVNASKVSVTWHKLSNLNSLWKQFIDQYMPYLYEREGVKDFDDYQQTFIQEFIRYKKIFLEEQESHLLIGNIPYLFAALEKNVDKIERDLDGKYIQQWFYTLAGANGHAGAESMVDQNNAVLNMAAKIGNLKVVSSFEDDDEMCFAFLAAAQYGNPHILKWMNDDFNLQLDEEWIASGINAAAENGHIEVINWMFDVYELSVEQLTEAFIIALQAEQIGTMDYLSLYIDLNEINFSREAYYQAFEGDQSGVAKWLLENISFTARLKKEFLQTAAEHGSHRTIEVFLERKKDKDISDFNLEKAFDVVCNKNHVHAFSLLIQEERIPYQCKINAFHRAVKRKNISILHVCLDKLFISPVDISKALKSADITKALEAGLDKENEEVIRTILLSKKVTADAINECIALADKGDFYAELTLVRNMLDTVGDIITDNQIEKLFLNSIGKGISDTLEHLLETNRISAQIIAQAFDTVFFGTVKNRVDKIKVILAHAGDVISVETLNAAYQQVRFRKADKSIKLAILKYAKNHHKPLDTFILSGLYKTACDFVKSPTRYPVSVSALGSSVLIGMTILIMNLSALSVVTSMLFLTGLMSLGLTIRNAVVDNNTAKTRSMPIEPLPSTKFETPDASILVNKVIEVEEPSSYKLRSRLPKRNKL